MRMSSAFQILVMAALLFHPCEAEGQWTQVADPGGGWVTEFAWRGPNLFAATRKHGVFRSCDDGATWKAVNSGLPRKADCQCFAVVGEKIFVGIPKHGVFVSADDGDTWTVSGPGLPPRCGAWRFAVSGSDLFAVAGKLHATVFRSSDGGATWSIANSGLGEAQVLDLAAVGPSLFAGTVAGIFLSTNGGTDWKAVNSGLPANPIPPGTDTKAAILRLAAIGNDVYAGTYWSGLVFRSLDGGGSWRPACLGLPDDPNFSLSDIVARGSDLFLGSFRGVFFSSNSGGSWERLDAGIPEDVSVYSLAAGEKFLFAGTEEGRVFRLPLSDLSLTVNLSDPVLTEENWAVIRKGSPKAAFIPETIKAFMQDAVDGRPVPRSVPFRMFKCLSLPSTSMPNDVLLLDGPSRILVKLPEKPDAARSRQHAILFFKARNADLGYAAAGPPSDAEREETPGGATSVHVASWNIFVEFRQTAGSGESKVVHEVLYSGAFEEDSSTYDPERENWYTLGADLRPGKYTAVVAIAPEPGTEKPKPPEAVPPKIGVEVFPFDLPGPGSCTASLETTPLFFVERATQESEEDIAMVSRKSSFLWSKNVVVPLLDGVVPEGSVLQLAYGVFGAQPKAEPGGSPSFDIEAIYEARGEDGTIAIRWDPLTYGQSFITQSLPLVQTLRMKNEEEERTKQCPLGAGRYILEIRLEDKISGLRAKKQIPFEIR